MQDMARNARRTPNGSIDYAHYDRLARRLRGRAAHRSVAGQRKALLTVLRVAWNAACRSAEIPAAAIARPCRAIVRFWNISPLGSVGLLQAHYERHANRSRFL